MKISKLRFVTPVYVGGTQGKCDTSTHDIERLPGEGFVVRYRKSGDTFFVPFSHAYAEIQAEAEEGRDAGDGAGDNTGRAPGRRGRKPQDTPAVSG